MQRFTVILILLAFFVISTVAPATAWIFGDDTLVTIGEETYDAEDFKRWWNFWSEEDTPLPETPQPYIDWLLLGQEARRMQLFEDPGFQRQTRIFLQSRTLLMLKHEEVDSQIEISEGDIKKRYEELYLPRWTVQQLKFKDEEAALAAWEELAEGDVTVEELVERDPEEGGPMSIGKIDARPRTIDPGWASIFEKMEVGKVVDPSEHGNGPILYLLKEQLGGDPQDLEGLRGGLRKEIWRQKEDQLTADLINRLREKYQVKINKERLAALDINAPDESFTDEPVITTSREDVSEKEFIAVIRRLMSTRPAAAHAAADEEAAQKFKSDTATNIIAQSVTNWASIDRKFEEEEPFKGEYDFNYNHRLGLALEQRLFAPKAAVSEEEIKQHYQENKERFTRPEMVKVYIIDDTQAPIAQIWADVAAGKNFIEVINKDYEVRPVLQEVPVNHLDPEVKEVVNKLAKGETSQVFEAQDIRVIVHLVDRTPQQPIPLARVKDSIRADLKREKLKDIRQDYLETIKSNTAIEVDKSQWKKIRKELGGA